ncbi:hypothetical protein BH20ACT23_BH20ACT23_12860 [soil metagenome]
MTNPRREVARGLVLNAADRLLLVKWRDPLTGREFWEPPGGGSQVGESFEATVRREVAEETGLADIEVGACVAEFDRRFVWAGREFDCVERYFICRLVTNRRIGLQLDEVERSGYLEIDWWSLSDLASTAEQLEPSELLQMLEARGR